MLHERGAKKEAAEIVEISVKEQNLKSRSRVPKKPRSKIFAVNKWLLVATILTIVSCVGLFIWAEYESQSVKPSPSVKKVNLENSEFKDFIQTARIDNDTFFGVTTAAWESLSREKKEEILNKLRSIGTDKSYKKVHLVNTGGKAVGFSSAEKTDVYNQ